MHIVVFLLLWLHVQFCGGDIFVIQMMLSVDMLNIKEATRHGGLGAFLSPSMSVKDRFSVCPLIMLNACLALSWPDKPFRPQSRVAQLRPGPGK